MSIERLIENWLLLRSLNKQTPTQTVKWAKRLATRAAVHSPVDHCWLHREVLSHSHVLVRQSSLRCLATALPRQPDHDCLPRAACDTTNIRLGQQKNFWVAKKPTNEESIFVVLTKHRNRTYSVLHVHALHNTLHTKVHPVLHVYTLHTKRRHKQNAVVLQIKKLRLTRGVHPA